MNESILNDLQSLIIYQQFFVGIMFYYIDYIPLLTNAKQWSVKQYVE